MSSIDGLFIFEDGRFVHSHGVPSGHINSIAEDTAGESVDQPTRTQAFLSVAPGNAVQTDSLGSTSDIKTLAEGSGRGPVHGRPMAWIL